MSVEKPAVKPASRILPRFAAQIANWNMTLQERFLDKLEHVSQELEAGNVYHAGEKAQGLVSNFIAQVRSSDCLARGDVLTFNKCVTELNADLGKIRFIEPPRQQKVA
jgi:hypothetical protein